MSIGLYFFAVRDFLPAIPLFLVFHFVLVFAIKWTFERARHLKGGVLTWLVATVNVFASSLVYVRIVPIEKSIKRRRRDKSASDECPSRASHAVEQHSTFFVQSLFFALALMENLLMASVPLLMGDNNRAYVCLEAHVLRDYMCRILALCVASWVFHTMYYKYMGHPWSDINGPDLQGGHVRFYFHFCGQERLFDCSCLKSRDGSERCCCCCRRRRLRVSCNVQENEYCFPPLEDDDDDCDDCDV